MRRFLISLLLCIAIPAQGFASIAVAACSCPMKHSAAMQQVAESAEMHQCCHQDEAPSKTCKSCKGGQHCQSTNWQFLGDGLAIQVPVTEQAVWISPRLQFVPSFDPSSVWRPPALV